jgi:hypothetical protein
MLPIGRYGTAGRGAAIALVGAYFLVSAIHGDPRQAHELGGVLKEMRALPLGAAITGAFWLAFIGSAVLDFVVAGFRHFNPRSGRERYSPFLISRLTSTGPSRTVCKKARPLLGQISSR